MTTLLDIAGDDLPATINDASRERVREAMRGVPVPLSALDRQRYARGHARGLASGRLVAGRATPAYVVGWYRGIWTANQWARGGDQGISYAVAGDNPDGDTVYLWRWRDAAGLVARASRGNGWVAVLGVGSLVPNGQLWTLAHTVTVALPLGARLRHLDGEPAGEGQSRLEAIRAALGDDAAELQAALAASVEGAR